MTEHELEIRDRPRANILLVDDRPENLVALAAVLEPLGENLVMAGSGEEALRELLLHEFAVILLDVQMPEMDGFAAAELIKQRERTRYVPIIFLTALSKDQAHVFRGYSAGAVDYVLIDELTIGARGSAGRSRGRNRRPGTRAPRRAPAVLSPQTLLHEAVALASCRRVAD